MLQPLTTETIERRHFGASQTSNRRADVKLPFIRQLLHRCSRLPMILAA